MSRRVVYAFSALAVLSSIVYLDIGNSRGLDSGFLRVTDTENRIHESEGENSKAGEDARRRGDYMNCTNLLRKNKYEEALRCLDELIKKYPDNKEYTDKKKEILDNLGWAEA